MKLTHPSQRDNIPIEAALRQRAASPDVTAPAGPRIEHRAILPAVSPCSNGPTVTDATSQPQPDAAKPALVLNSRAELRDVLIDAGLARGAAEKVARGGWPALSGGLTKSDLAEDCADLARQLAETLTGV
jgi:hypothetical protein